LLIIPPNSEESTKALESSLKRHTALIKRIRQSIGLDNRDHILKDIETLTLEKYIEEIAGAVPEGIARCKFEKDVWSAAEVRRVNWYSRLHPVLIHAYMPTLGHLCSPPTFSNQIYTCARHYTRWRTRVAE
jgi:regulator of nonsense transcripts 2